ncbi:MAG: Crp/Fnr family transcriptional regulator [Mesorhizobium sp.]|nr:Crp/Fnr family transcriptional regulator [Mesorhizobium sp. M1D.F.Ca.ET.043.01.1.1]AZO73828.1 Crp/Fnr family transcriptional regulator [Mesorhizobium sp. M1D.F.Ca.ET.043.01.1.1]RWA95407.1 MAG: cyclic nucleotide-binding domain-containing protein [Mesorhizobium sp.]RWE08490.1 MAG: cyclic nucleotide-binding domain-containing protein [Mesorhizobium sp.]TJW81493.1 MAG: Crp/Fnr family transcriptional regulator [Mesorhizobium sp.]
MPCVAGGQREHYRCSTVREDIHTKGIPVLCVSCEARHRGICGALSPDQLVTLSKSTKRHKAEAGRELVSDVGSVDRFSNVLSGVVKLTKTLSDGRQQIVGLQFAPDFLGRPFQTESTLTAEAATDVELCSFPRQTLERMMKEQPDLEHRLLEQKLRELDQSRDWMVALGRKTAAEKIASFLLMIARNIDPAAGPERRGASFDLPLTRAEIADFLGLTVETVSRQITRLRGENVIRVENNRRVMVDDIQRLAARAGD